MLFHFVWSIAIFCESHWVLRHGLVKMQLQHCVELHHTGIGEFQMRGRWPQVIHSFLERSLIRLFSSDHYIISAILRKLIGSRKVGDFGIWRTPGGREAKRAVIQERRPANLTGVYLGPNGIRGWKGLQKWETLFLGKEMEYLCFHITEQIL